MGKVVHNDVLDAAHTHTASTGNRMFICSAEPTTYLEASTTYALAENIMTLGDGNGDYVIQNGVTSGRRLTVTEQTGILVDEGGIANHVAICDSAASVVLLVTTCTPQTLTAGNTVAVPTFDHEILAVT